MKRNIGWMRDLAFHYESMRVQYPHKDLMIVFDIDGTIIDIPHMVLSVLKSYDRDHGTRYFSNLVCEDLMFNSLDLGCLPKGIAMPSGCREEVSRWCRENFWSRATVLEAHKPMGGVLDVIRWFQLQPNTYVALSSSRPEELREVTLGILNTIGGEYHVRFDDEFLFMNTGTPIPQGKVEGIRHFRELGYQIVAVIDNDQGNLEAMAGSDVKDEMLLLHADVILKSSRARSAGIGLQGNCFDLTELISRRRLPGPIEFVWHGVDDESILRQFLVSSVQWAELHVREKPGSSDLILRRKSYAELPEFPGETPARLDDFLYILGDSSRGVKLDLKDPGLTSRVIELLRASGFTDDRIWITINIEELRRGGLKLIMEAFPGAIKQCPVDSLSGLMSDSPAEARKYIGMLANWGIDRFSVNWSTPSSRRLITQLQNWGFEVNIYNVPNLESFLQAALLIPKSITSFFNFPKWFYTGSAEGMDQCQGAVLKRMQY